MTRLTPLLALALLAACTDDLPYEGAFDTPSAGAVTADGAEIPFDEPIAYVASLLGGSIRTLATKQGRFLTDDTAASFLRGNPLPTGRARTLTSLQTWTPTPDRISVFAADQTFGHLLEVPHVLSVGASGPEEPLATVSDWNASGGATLSGLEVKSGYTATETWTLTWQGNGWIVEGSRSGRLNGLARPGEPYVGAERLVAFTASEGTALGETITFSTTSGLTEHDLAATPIYLAMHPAQDLLAVATVDDDDGTYGLLWWDPATAAIMGDVDLPEGAHPGRMAFQGDTLWVTDTARGGLYKVALGAFEVTEIPLPFPTMDVAPSATFDRLFVSESGGTMVWILDTTTSQLIDVNPAAPGIQGLDTFSPVQGIGALPGEVWTPSSDDDGVRRRAHVVAISLYSGPVVFMDQETGCLLSDGLGPRTDTGALPSNDPGLRRDHVVNFSGLTGGPSLFENASNNRNVLVNNCPGIARSEGWELRYDASAQAWRVEGELSGIQRGYAYEDQRYVSDNGEFSLLVRGGARPSVDGWTIRFAVDDGVLRVLGDQNGDGSVTQIDAEVPFALPGDPLPVRFRIGDRGAPWETVEERSYALIPLQGADAVSRVLPDTGLVDATWR